MKIATHYVNGVNGRLPILLKWLEEAQREVVCLQQLKAQQTNFPKPTSATQLRLHLAGSEILE